MGPIRPDEDGGGAVSATAEAETKMITTQIRCPFCNKRANDVVYPADARTFRVVTICANRQCRRGYTIALPEREKSEATAA